jgi:predicted Zn-dependent protease
VKFNSEGIGWQKTVTDTKLTYPTQKPALRAGSVTKVTIIANFGNSYLSESNAILNLLTSSEAKQVRAAIERIKSLNLSPDERAFDLNAVYRSQDLLTEAINTLKARTSAGSNNPTIYRILGDRYLEAGLPFYAKQQFTTAAALAQKAENEAELALAQAGLKRAKLYSQLPTKMNGDQ